jgi:hypothetical protein
LSSSFLFGSVDLDSPVESPENVRGVFCDDATWRAEGDYNVGLGLKKEESNPKFNREPKVRPKG